MRLTREEDAWIVAIWISSSVVVSPRGLRFSVGGVDGHAGVVEVRHDLRNDPAEPVQAVGRRN